MLKDQVSHYYHHLYTSTMQSPEQAGKRKHYVTTTTIPPQCTSPTNLASTSITTQPLKPYNAIPQTI